MSPYAIEGPAVVSFSGGRTSAFMLRKMLDAGLEPDVHVLFADTGKERPETYEFVDRCGEAWGVEIHHVERPGGFEKLITDRTYLPNVVTRFCTTELKVRPIKKWMQGRGYKAWTMVVGIRADEAHRARRLRSGEGRDPWDYEFPMVEDEVSVADVNRFWCGQAFDLELRPDEGNCDLCFLKGRRKLVRIVAERPELAEWWLEQEKRIGGLFNKRGSMRNLMLEADAQRRQLSLPILTDEDDGYIDCLCGD